VTYVGFELCNNNWRPPQGKGYSVLVSDMCPSVSGDRSKDAALSAELGMCALHLALGQSEADDSIPETGGILLPGGSLVIKLLEGEESQGTCQNTLLLQAPFKLRLVQSVE
jgi:23S rRNA U2552 (ribose-2'-O)-methylase RlmE/FtsJ